MPADILVIDIELIFERIQFRIAVDLPPIAAKSCILGLCDAPFSGFFNLRGRFFVYLRRSCHGRKIPCPTSQSGSTHKAQRLITRTIEQAAGEIGEIRHFHKWHSIPPIAKVASAAPR